MRRGGDDLLLEGGEKEKNLVSRERGIKELDGRST